MSTNDLLEGNWNFFEETKFSILQNLFLGNSLKNTKFSSSQNIWKIFLKQKIKSY